MCVCLCVLTSSSASRWLRYVSSVAKIPDRTHFLISKPFSRSHSFCNTNRHNTDKKLLRCTLFQFFSQLFAHWMAQNFHILCLMHEQNPSFISVLTWAAISLVFKSGIEWFSFCRLWAPKSRKSNGNIGTSKKSSPVTSLIPFSPVKAHGGALTWKKTERQRDSSGCPL